jgi:hypothetical protein
MSNRQSSEAQPNRSLTAGTAQTDKTVAATDELFKQQPPVVPDPKATEESATAAPLDEEDELPARSDAPGHSATVPDYVRELQLEFEEQQEEGKI